MIIKIGQYLRLRLIVEVIKLEKLKVPSLLMKNKLDIRKIIEMISKSLFDKSSINKTKKAVPRIKNREGKTICDILKKS